MAVVAAPWQLTPNSAVYDSSWPPAAADGLMPTALFSPHPPLTRTGSLIATWVADVT